MNKTIIAIIIALVLGFLYFFFSMPQKVDTYVEPTPMIQRETPIPPCHDRNNNPLPASECSKG